MPQDPLIVMADTILRLMAIEAVRAVVWMLVLLPLAVYAAHLLKRRW